jgi:hypothetical protein
MTTTPIIPHPTTTPAPLVLLLSSLLLAIFLGALAGTLELYCHLLGNPSLIVLTESLIVLAFGASLGFLLTRLFRTFNSRSKSLRRLCTLSAAFVGLYTAWIAWISNFTLYFSHNAPLPRFFLPARMLDIIGCINQLGTWTLWGKPPTGPLLTGIWFAEAFTVIALATRITEWKRPKAPAA